MLISERRFRHLRTHGGRAFGWAPVLPVGADDQKAAIDQHVENLIALRTLDAGQAAALIGSEPKSRHFGIFAFDTRDQIVDCFRPHRS